MNREELTTWFWSVLNLCYPLYDKNKPNFIQWYYNEQFVRKIKLCKINNQRIIIPDKFKGDFVFEQNIKFKILYINCDNIWNFFRNNYSKEDIYINIFINEILNNSTNFKGYKSYMTYNYDGFLLNNNKNFELYV